MPPELVFAPEAEDDIVVAYAWYEDRRPGLGEEFLSATEACLAKLQRAPELHAPVHENYRRALLRRFPYAVFYEYAGGRVTVYGVLHTARDPASWQQRLP